MSLLPSGAIETGGYDINNSLRFRSSASAYLNRTPASAGNRTTWTWSCWVKKTPLASGVQAMIAAGVSTTVYDDFCFENDQIRFVFNNGTYDVKTTQVFRDPSAWYHVIVAMDTTQATASNRVKIYVNGSQVTAFATANYPVQNHNTNINNNILNNIGNLYNGSFSSYFDGYLAEVNFIDGSAKTPSDFGETDAVTGVWKPKAYTGTYGTNGFYLKFSDIATTSGSNAGLGKDFSGNGNYWTTNNISVTSGSTYDAMTDSPTLTSATVSNYCVLNPVAYYGGYNVLSQGNLQFTSGNTNWMRAVATFAVSSGKWYWEITANNSLSQMHGILTATTTTYYSGATNWVGYDSTGYGYFSDNGQKWNNNAGATYGSTFGAGDIIGVAFDADNGTLIFYRNGVSQGTAFTGLTSGPYVPAVSVATTSGANTCSANFGQRPFAYTPPTGYVALNTYNLPTPTILQGNKYMDATLATGNNSTQVITNAAGFRPDFVWLKIRSGVENHIAYDSVRGAQQYLVPNLTLAEATLSSGLTSFNSNGFTLGNANPNYSGSPTFVAWQWQAGQGSTSSNTSGSITSTVSVNTTAGFSVVTYTGTGANATVGHGLGVAPRMIICKNRASATDWAVYHASVGNTGALRLNLTAVTETDSRYWNNTTPTSTVFSIGSSSTVNGSSNTQVAYCWAEIAGFSRFGSYTGNGSTDGTFVYTGFRPEFIMFKRTNDVSDWNILDTTRSPYNTSITRLFANSSNAENSSAGNYDIDILSNGFKQRNTNTSTASNSNLNGSTYIFMAFAESPFKNSLAR